MSKPYYKKPGLAVEDPLFVDCMQPKDSTQVELSGQLESVRVVNTGSGWGFGKLYVREKRIVVSFTGNVASVYEGAQITLRGRWKQHERYGWQVDASAVIVDLPEDSIGVRMWLETHFPDIGPQRASAVLRVFPPEVLWHVLENEPELLEQVDGIGPKLSAQIAAHYQFVKAERDCYIGLADFGLKAEQIRDAVKRWGRKTLETLKEDPYRLVELGLSFKLADGLGMRNGIKRADPRRIVAGHVAAMIKTENDGHTAVSAKQLQSVACGADILNISFKDVIAQWQTVLDRGQLVEVEPGVVSLATRAKQENVIAAFVLEEHSEPEQMSVSYIDDPIVY
jgi:exodeoxyribonuclease V alpha subunit